MSKSNAVIAIAVLGLLMSCGKSRSKDIPITQQSYTPGMVVNAEATMGEPNTMQLSVSSASHSYRFNAKRAIDGRTGKRVIFATHNSRRVGKEQCLEYKGNYCSVYSFNVDFVDRGARFQGEVIQKLHTKKLPVEYFETETSGGSTETNKYSYAVYRRFEVGKRVVHSIELTDYSTKIEQRDQVFSKKVSLADGSTLHVMGKIPRRSTRKENIYTDAHRNGFRSKQNNDFSVALKFTDNVIFKGTEAKSELDRLFDNDNREVGLRVPGLEKLLN